MQRYSLNKIPSMFGAICDYYEATTQIDQDKTPALTREAYAIYRDTITQKTGNPDIGYEKMPEKYAIFIKVKEEAIKHGVTNKVYIAAQFEAFGFRDGIPDPLQMIGDKALTRLQQYCFSNNIRMGYKKGGPAIDFSKLRSK